jgi:hypothetical protein
MNIYVAGPMRGIPQFNFPAFNSAAKRLRASGHSVFNPAERDIAEHGDDFVKDNDTGSEEQATQDFGFDLREALGDDLAWICKHADAIYLLTGWEDSRGAKAEKAVAEALNLEVYYEYQP